MAKGHAGRSDVASEVKILTTVETSWVLAGCTMHFGDRMAVVDQRWLFARLYPADFGPNTCLGKEEESFVHFEGCQRSALNAHSCTYAFSCSVVCRVPCGNESCQSDRAEQYTPQDLLESHSRNCWNETAFSGMEPAHDLETQDKVKLVEED